MPDELFDERGYLKDGLGKFLDYRIEKVGLGINKIVIEIGSKNSIVKEKTRNVMLLNYKDLVNLQKRIKAIRYKSKLDLGNEFDLFLHENFPKHFKAPANHSESITQK